MNKKELFEKVSREADTAGTSINVAEVSRVGHLILEHLKLLSDEELVSIINSPTLAKKLRAANIALSLMQELDEHISAFLSKASDLDKLWKTCKS